MRLVCPNCVAQYEVDNSAIPPSGRDVQCAACNHTWFQDAVDMLPAEDIAVTRKELDPEVKDILRSEAEFAQAARAAEQAETQPDASEPETPEQAPAPEEVEEPTPAPQPQTEPQKPSTPEDDLAAKIKALEEEFEAETGQSLSADPAPMPPPVAEDKPRKVYRAPVEDEEAPLVSDSDKPIARKDRLPDVDDIEEDLDEPEDFYDDDDDELEDTVKRGFAWGFWMIIVLAVLLVLIYIFAAQIIEVLPQAKQAVEWYVALIDRLRIVVEEQYGNLMAMISSPDPNP